MRIFIHARRGWLPAAATPAALGLAGPAMAQYSPYTGQQPYGPVATAPVATTPVAGHQGYVPYGTAMGQAPQHQQHQQQPPQYMTQGAYQGY
ncbi:MAG TPA: hypothetical protein PKC18_10245, partial [Lacipirellulaceae bacterium]|nr:hypothetical protein [Lacipirellulaceae bacterium]